MQGSESILFLARTYQLMSLWLVSKEKFHSSLTTQKNQLNGESVSMFWQILPPAMSAPSSPTMAKSPQGALSNQTFHLHPELFFNFFIISDKHGLTSAVSTFLLTDFIQAQHLPVNLVRSGATSLELS